MQCRAVREAIEASRVLIEQRFDRLEGEMRSRFTVVEAAIQSMNEGVESLQRIDATRLALDDTRSMLEQRLARSDPRRPKRVSALDRTRG